MKVFVVLLVYGDLPKHDKNFSPKIQLVDSPRKRMGAIQHLLCSRSHADGPRRAWRPVVWAGFFPITGRISDRPFRKPHLWVLI
jgi:hypothetical protein